MPKYNPFHEPQPTLTAQEAYEWREAFVIAEQQFKQRQRELGNMPKRKK